MKLIDALKISQQPAGSTPFSALLACGFTPLHLRTYLHAHLQILLKDRKVEVAIGNYGDLLGTLSSPEVSNSHAAAIVIEWADLDARLGLRQLGGWAPSVAADVLKTASSRLQTIRARIEAIAKQMPVAVSTPTLPLVPISFTPTWQTGQIESRLRQEVFDFAAAVGDIPNVRLLRQQRLDLLSPLDSRFDVKSELLTGFSYTAQHADVMGELLARCLVPRVPMKGLISDLDDTLWAGILGEVGAEAVCWDLSSHAQLHGVYQQLLASLAEEGVLIAVASKNAPDIVETAFARKDILLSRTRCFPMEVSWGRKSEAVSRILRAWNISEDSVVFVDDSEMELAEVKASHPGIRCLRFPKDDYKAAWEFFHTLRDFFGKDRVSDEDSLRLASLRSAQERSSAAETAGTDPDEFLRQSRAVISVSFAKSPADPRALELINKTNQFNLNGRRYTEVEWQRFLEDPDSFLILVSYTDKYGPLGKIAVIAGKKQDCRLCVCTWVMSCRAFARRIEHRCLEVLFDRFGAEEISFNFVGTPRNGPTQDYFAEVNGTRPEGETTVTREQFKKTRPGLYHELEISPE